MKEETIKGMTPGQELDALVQAKIMKWTHLPNKDFCGTKFEPSRTIVDAWFVVEKLKEKGWNVSVGVCSCIPNYNHCSVETAARSEEIVCDSAPEAIAKAALLTLRKRAA